MSVASRLSTANCFSMRRWQPSSVSSGSSNPASAGKGRWREVRLMHIRPQLQKKVSGRSRHPVRHHDVTQGGAGTRSKEGEAGDERELVAVARLEHARVRLVDDRYLAHPVTRTAAQR